MASRLRMNTLKYRGLIPSLSGNPTSPGLGASVRLRDSSEFWGAGMIATVASCPVIDTFNSPLPYRKEPSVMIQALIVSWQQLPGYIPVDDLRNYSSPALELTLFKI